jgi:hypothetical protein
MPIQEDLLQAKQVLSASLLRAGLRGGVVGMVASVRVDRAIAAAGHNVHAVGIGRKVVAGHVSQIPCIRVYVVQKIAESLLPPIYRIPESVDGIPTDVIESPPAFILPTKRSKSPKSPKAPKKPRGRKTTARAAATAIAACSANRRKRQRPVVAGISAGHFNITAGTIGYFCRSTRHGDDPAHVFALSNNHVFANVNQALVGDDLYQPGPLDGGTAADRFADLTRWVPIQTGGTVPNRVDAAIGRLSAGVAHLAEVCSIGPITGTAQATEGMLVRKHGRTTGYTEGEVTDESYDALIGMDHDDPSVVALFEDQMRIERVAPYPAIGLGGDSGSLVVSQEDALAVGLYFAGPPSGTYGIANHIRDVLNELEIQLL